MTEFDIQIANRGIDPHVEIVIAEAGQITIVSAPIAGTDDELRPSVGGQTKTLYFASTAALRVYINTLSGNSYRFGWIVDDDDGFGPANGFFDGTDIHYNVAIIIT